MRRRRKNYPRWPKLYKRQFSINLKIAQLITDSNLVSNVFLLKINLHNTYAFLYKYVHNRNTFVPDSIVNLTLAIDIWIYYKDAKTLKI